MSTRVKAPQEVSVQVKPFGPSSEELAAIGRRLPSHPSLRKMIGRSRTRLLYVEALDDLEEKLMEPRPPSRFRATFIDETNQRTLLAEGSIRNPNALEITESASAPHPSEEEFEEAQKILRGDAIFGRLAASGQLEIYQPIPAVDLEELPDGSVARRIMVGLLPRSGEVRHEIVSVDLGRRTVSRFEGRYPTPVRPRNTGACGVPHAAGQSTASKGTSGQVWVTVKRGGTTLWRFLAVRPAASSGTNGSGIELRYVDFKGKRVLYRAHVPILNVKYQNNACGPYRDWQYQEGMIQATGTTVAPGFMLSTTPALTILDTGSDVGNFLGVGIYLVGDEVVLVSEMQAGWYRYVSQWRLGADGTIRPRFAFAAVEHPCVCNVHHHHVYWRFDFDIRSAGNNRVREYNDPPLVGNSNWHDKRFEIRRPRDYTRKRKWRVENTRSGEAYEIVPNPDDGVAAHAPDWPFGRGDVWILRYRGSEIDDGVVAIGPPYEANIDQWVNGESIEDQDVVVWYGGHFTHDVTHAGAAQHGHIVGPDLKPAKW